MTKSIAFLFAASMLFLTTACDPADEPTTERSAEIEVDADAEEPDGHHDGKHGEHAKFAVEKLCSELDCTETQATQIAELLAKKHESRDEGDREARKTERDAANKVLADAFRADVFDASVLARAKPDRHRDHEAHMLAMATELHALLTPEQRATLADKIQQDGPMFFVGKRGHGKHGEGPHGDKHPDKVDGPHGDPAERVAGQVQHLCEKVICTAEQQAQLTELFTSEHQARHADKKQRPEADFSAVAALFRADTLDAAKLAETMAAAKADHEQRKAERDKGLAEHLASVHAILTPEQRAVLADLIEDKGLHALMGGKHGKHGKRGKHGKDRRDGQG